MGLAGRGVRTVAVSFSKGQKECFQSSPLGQDIIWSKCAGETFDIFRFSFYIWVVSHHSSTHSATICVSGIANTNLDNSSYLVTSKYSGVILSPSTI